MTVNLLGFALHNGLQYSTDQILNHFANCHIMDFQLRSNAFIGCFLQLVSQNQLFLCDLFMGHHSPVEPICSDVCCWRVAAGSVLSCRMMICSACVWNTSSKSSLSMTFCLFTLVQLSSSVFANVHNVLGHPVFHEWS